MGIFVDLHQPLQGGWGYEGCITIHYNKLTSIGGQGTLGTKDGVGGAQLLLLLHTKDVREGPPAPSKGGRAGLSCPQAGVKRDETRRRIKKIFFTISNSSFGTPSGGAGPAPIPSEGVLGYRRAGLLAQVPPTLRAFPGSRPVAYKADFVPITVAGQRRILTTFPSPADFAICC